VGRWCPPVDGADYPVDAGSLTASMRSMLLDGARSVVRARRTTARPRGMRVSDIRVRCTPRGSISCAWRRRDASSADRARTIA